MTGAQPCFHCGEPVPPGSHFEVDIDGISQPMCCPGCRAVASLIADSGMGSFYRQRTAYSEKPANDAPLATPDEYLLYDDPTLRAQYCRRESAASEHASLLLGGVTCAACTWLIEQTLLRETGVQDAQVNLQQQRLSVRYDPQQLQPSRVFALLESLGYSARPFQASAQREQLEQDYRTDLRRVAVAGIGMMQVGMFGIALHAGDLQGIATEHQILLRTVSLLVASFVVGYSAKPFFVTAWRHLRQGALVMDLPVALAIGLAFIASVWATVTGSGEVYFDSVVMFTFFLLLGRFFEKRVRRRHAIACRDAESHLPLAVLVQQTDGHWRRQSRRQVQPGDTVRVRAGEVIAVDGTVATGSSAVREDTFNGEHVPRTVAPGDAVFAGTLNLEGSIDLRVDQLYENSRLAALQNSVDRAQRAKPALARMADRLSAWFVGAILVITALTGLVWSQIAPDQVLWICLAVLVVSCPCALALATPAALTAAASALRAQGVIVHGENAIEALAHAQRVVFDKTGTLTQGKLRLETVSACGEVNDAFLTELATALQQHSNHPIAHAFTGTAITGISEPRYITGAGIEASWNGQRYRMGSERFCRELAPTLPNAPNNELYWVALCSSDQPLAWFGLSDPLRPEAAEVVAAARSAGMSLALLTGDSSSAGARLGRELGFDFVSTGLSPEDKMQQVRAWQEAGEVVMAVGDGLNDAPLLGLANASFAVASATDLARAQADFVVDDDNLNAVIRSLTKARQCVRIIRQNFVWALSYNGLGIPLAALGYIPPWAAALGMSVSSLIVVMNSLRLNRTQP
jgi:Cu2+-exporting ATPase